MYRKGAKRGSLRNSFWIKKTLTQIQRGKFSYERLQSLFYNKQVYDEKNNTRK